MFALHARIFPVQGYKGKPYCRKAQIVPGRLECAYYDEGIAYHDKDPLNHGSGELNHKPGHCEPGVPENICFFRKNEGVDISYTEQRADFDTWRVIPSRTSSAPAHGNCS